MAKAGRSATLSRPRALEGRETDQQNAIIILIAAVIGILAIAIILARHDREAGASSAGARTAASSEGETICPSCGMGNLVGDTNCAACGASLPSHQAPAEG